MAASVRVVSYAKRPGSSTVLTLSTNVVAGDWVALITRRLGSQARHEVPAWLEHQGERIGAYAGWQANTSIYAGVAPTSLSTITITDTIAAQTDAMLVAIQGAQADAIQASAFSTGSPNPMPGFTQPGGCLLLLLEDHSGAAFFAGPYPGEEVALEAEGPFTARAQRVTSDATGDLLLGPPISGGWRAGMAFAIPHAGAAARIRSSVSEDAGSLFQATQAVAVELGLSEAFEYGTDLGSGLRSFREALTPDEIAVSYYPLPTRNQEMLTTVEGETNLGRLARTVPGSIMQHGDNISGNVDGRVTAQQAIAFITSQWASEHPWLVFEPIPDLRFVTGADAVAAPRQHYLDNPDAGVLTLGAVTIPQEDGAKRSMREILDEWLEIFTGTIPRQTSRGTIELVPRVGPDAPDGVAEALTWDDMLAMSDGEDDPSGVTNRARVTSQGWEWTDETPLIPPSFLVVRAQLGLAESVLDDEEVLPDGSRQREHAYELLRFLSVLSDDEPITVDVEIYAYGSHSQSSALNFSLEGQVTRQVTLARGQGQNVSITHNSRSQNITATYRVERTAMGGPDGITITTPQGIPQQASNLFGVTFFAYVLDVDVEGTGWVRTNESITGEFGQIGDHVPGPGGTNALAESRALHGERLATIQSNVFQLTPEQAQQVARSYVLWNMNPRTIREVQQSEWNKYPVKFDHIGRYIDLPNGERAVVENRAYSDTFQPLSGQMQSTFTAAVTDVVIDTSTALLYLDNGDFFQLDSGDLVEVS